MILPGLILGACATMQPVRPLPKFIQAAVDPGDQVKVTTLDSENRVLVVTEVTDTALIGEGQVIAFKDIKSISLKSREPLKYPCGGEVPLGCSVPALAKVAEQRIMNYLTGNLSLGAETREDPFHFDCVQHDFCYRHGFSTYNHDQKTCDDNFRDDMFQTCGNDAACTLLATQYYAAVQAHIVSMTGLR